MKSWILKNLEKGSSEVIDLWMFTIREWLTINFTAWGFYKVIMTQPGVYQVWYKFADILCKEVQG